MTEQEARDGLATGEFTAYGPATARLYATLDGTQIVSIKTAHDLDRVAGTRSKEGDAQCPNIITPTGRHLRSSRRRGLGPPDLPYRAKAAYSGGPQT